MPGETPTLKNLPPWFLWLNTREIEELRFISASAIERLMELEEVNFEQNKLEDRLFWKGNGQDLRDFLG